MFGLVPPFDSEDIHHPVIGVRPLDDIPPAPFSGVVSPGEFVTFMLYTQQFIWPLAQFGQIVNGYQRAAASTVCYTKSGRSRNLPIPSSPTRSRATSSTTV